MAFKQVRWATIKKDEDCSSLSSSSSSIDDSLSSSDLGDDASSSSSSSSSRTYDNDSSSNGPLYELADLMAHLPIKRGLSKFYNGKSQTFGSLSSVKSVEDLGKMSCSTRIKSCKNNGRSLNNIYHKFGPKARIAKRPTKTSCSPDFGAKSSFFIHGYNPTN